MSTFIQGSGGKGGGSTPTEQDNTVRTHGRVKVVNAISEGEIEGIAGGAQGIYLDNTPLQNEDGTYNFAKVVWDWRAGLPAQTKLDGFDGSASIINVGVNVTTATPVVRTITNADTDAVRVGIAFPQGLLQMDDKGNIKQNTVQFAIEARDPAGTWSGAPITLTEKVSSQFEKAYRVEKPASAAGNWEVRVRRITPDFSDSKHRGDIQLSRIVEIETTESTYDNTAVVGLDMLAESFGGRIPKIGFLTKGLLIDVPSNYNVATRAYTGLWDGTFVKAPVACDNPAWVLYDLITNQRYGLGEWLHDQVDVWSFYDAAIYCDELVSNGKGGQEPRFTFNYAITQRDEGLRLLNAVAGAMRCRLATVNGLITLFQDRPADVVKLFTKANVIDGLFTYASSGLLDRHTAINVSWQDRADGYNQRITTIDTSTINTYASNYADELAAAESLFGYNVAEISAYGCTTEGQAIRQGLWTLDTEINQTELVTFRAASDAAYLLPNDVIEIYDTDYTMVNGGGRLIGVTGTSLQLDRTVPLVPGSKIKVQLVDGSIEERSIVQTSGDASTVTVSSAFSKQAPVDAIYIVSHAVAARQFRVLSIRQTEQFQIEISAVAYDPNKFSRIENNIDVPARAVGATQPSRTGPVGAVSFRETAVTNAELGLDGVHRQLIVAWAPPALGQPRSYIVTYQAPTGEKITQEVGIPTITIDNARLGQYDITVVAVSFHGLYSTPVEATYTIDASGGGASALNAPTNLQVVGGGTTFTSQELSFQWTNPGTNLGGTLLDFEIRYIELTNGTTVRTEWVRPVAAGQTQVSLYTYAMNVADGGPRRSIKVEVRCRDTNRNLSDPVVATFTNPAPGLVGSLTATGSFNTVFLKWSAPSDPDVKGYFVWRDSTADFTPAAANLVSQGDQIGLTDSSLLNNTAYYYKVAAYDSFGKDVTGAGMNVSAAVSTTTLDPGRQNEWMLENITWKPNDPAGNNVSWTAATAIKTLGQGAGSTQAISAGSATWTSGVLYVYFTPGSSTLMTETSLPNVYAQSGQIVAAYRGGTNLEVGNGKVFFDGSYILAGTVGANQLVTGSAVITQGAQIATAIIDQTKIVDASITNAKIANAAVDLAKINTASITSLSSLSATIGTLRTSASGGRVEISDNQIRIYDSSNALRGKIGNLTY